MAQSYPRLHDGSTFITRGINSGSSPDALPRNQLSFAVNAALRGDKPHQRPGFLRRVLTFESVDVQTAFESGLFQGTGTYVWRDSDQSDTSQILVSISGRIYRIDVKTFSVTDITIPGDPNPSNRPQAWFEQGEMFEFIQDGQSLPLIYDGVSMRRANPLIQEIPTGTIMQYALGRMTVVLPDGRSFLAGNLVGTTDSGTAAYQFRDSIISFNENNYINGGGVFTAPRRISALREIATIDSTLAKGPLQIFTSSGAYSANYPFIRDEWLDVEYPLVTGSLLSRGALSQNATVNINNDLWFRSNDGIRTLRISRRNFDGWGDTPLSHEVERILRFDTPTLLGFSSGVFFDNRLLMTCSPRFIADRGIVHLGLVVLDFDEASSIARDGIPAYDGLWTGLRVLQILCLPVDDIDRCFMLVLDPDDKISLYEITLSDPADNYGTSFQQRIPWLLEYARLNFGENLVTTRRYKKLDTGDVMASNMSGEVDFTIRYRADSYPVWSDWAAWSECADLACVPLFCGDPNQPQAREPMRLPSPADICEEYAGTNAGKGTPKLTRFGYAFQVRLEIIGTAQIESLRISTIEQPEPLYDACRATEPCVSLQACNPAIFGYQVE